MTPATGVAAVAAAAAAEAHTGAPAPGGKGAPAGPERIKNMLGIIKSCAANVSPRLRPAMPSLDALRASPHYPVLVTPDPSQPNVTYNGSSDLTGPLPINGVGPGGGVIEWENDLWKGRIVVHLRGLPTTRDDVFEGKKRLTWGMAQGVFKRPVKVSEVMIGQEIEVAARGPSEYIIQAVATHIAHSFSQTCLVDVHCESPYFLNPLLAACQLVNVSRPGQEPSDLYNVPEDCRLLHPALVEADGSAWTADKRRKWCDTPANVEGLEFQPGLVYSFGWWQHFFDLAAYKAHAGPFIAVDLCPFMSAQPIQMFIKHTGTGQALLDLLIWHHRLLYPEVPEGKEDKRAAKAAKKAAAASSGGAGDDDTRRDADATAGVRAGLKNLLSGWRAA